MIPLKIQMVFYIFTRSSWYIVKTENPLANIINGSKTFWFHLLSMIILFFGNRNLTHILGSANFFPANYALVNFWNFLSMKKNGCCTIFEKNKVSYATISSLSHLAFMVISQDLWLKILKLCTPLYQYTVHSFYQTRHVLSQNIKISTVKPQYET